MPKGFYDVVVKRLKSAGYGFERNGKGSHEMWTQNETRRKVTVPRHLKSRHTANAILKNSGIDEKV